MIYSGKKDHHVHIKSVQLDQNPRLDQIFNVILQNNHSVDIISVDIPQTTSQQLASGQLNEQAKANEFNLIYKKMEQIYITRLDLMQKVENQ